MSAFDYFSEQATALGDEVFTPIQDGESIYAYAFGILKKISTFLIIEMILFGALYKIWIRYDKYKVLAFKDGHLEAKSYATSTVLGFISKNPGASFLGVLVVLGSFIFIARASIKIQAWLGKYKVLALFGLYKAMGATWHGVFSNQNDKVVAYLKFFAWSFIGK